MGRGRDAREGGRVGRDGSVDNFAKVVEKLLAANGAEGDLAPLFQSGSGAVPRDTPYRGARHAVSPTEVGRDAIDERRG